MRAVCISIFLIVLVIFPSASFADTPVEQARPWNLPIVLDAENTKIEFFIETTWDTVEGLVKSVEGKIWLDDPKDFSSVRVDTTLPVAKFDCDDEDTDETVRDSMAESVYPVVHVVTNKTEGLCVPSQVTGYEACPFALLGDITIRDVTKPVKLDAQISLLPSGKYQVTGSTRFKWSDFGVEDPSILIMRVHKTVDVKFKIEM